MTPFYSEFFPQGLLTKAIRWIKKPRQRMGDFWQLFFMANKL
jgi:hypothetical protein